jgi:cell division protein FtsQ
MRNSPALVNALASALFGLAAALALHLAWALATRLPAFELAEVEVSGGLARVTRAQIEGVVRRELKGNILTLDLAAARAAFQALPWVRRVDMRRHLPARLEVALEEHVPLARWAGSALVNTHGEVFAADLVGELPVFSGPEGSAREIAIQYRYFRRTLEAIGQTPVQVRVSPRLAWQLKLDSGLTLELGREHIEARLARFVATYHRTLGRLGRPVRHVDLRYANGFAVRLPVAGDGTGKPRRGRRPG